MEELLRTLLETSLSNPDTHELEIRLGHCPEVGRKFSNDVGSELFSNVMRRLETNRNWSNKLHEKTIDYFDLQHNARATVRDSGEEKMIKKTRLITQDFKNFDASSFTARVSLSTEEPYEGPFGDELDLSRTKDRMSYMHTNKHGMMWRYDLTMVSTDNGHDIVEDLDEDNGNFTHEIELEVPVLRDKALISYCADSTVMKVRDLIAMLNG
jgi:hypothetical protein